MRSNTQTDTQNQAYEKKRKYDLKSNKEKQTTEKELEGIQILEILNTDFKVNMLNMEGRPTCLRRHKTKKSRSALRKKDKMLRLF